MTEYWILMKQRQPHPYDRADNVHAAAPHCVCSSIEDLEAVLQSIATNGPDEDEGPFDHHQMVFWAVKVKPRGQLAQIRTEVLG